MLTAFEVLAISSGFSFFGGEVKVKHGALLVIAAGLCDYCPATALGDLVSVISQSRTTVATVDIAPTNLPTLPNPTLNQSSQSATAGTSFSSTAPAILNLTYANYPSLPTAYYNGTATAVQNSTISPSGLSGTGSVYASSVETNEGQTESNGSSSFLVTFTVSTPTPINLSGEVTGQQAYHLGWLEMIDDSVTLSGSTAGTLFSATYFDNNVFSTAYTYDDPFAMTTTLVPGQVYTLSALDYVDSRRGLDDTGESTLSPGSAAFAFSLTAVPEPISAIAIGLAIPLFRRRIRHPALASGRWPESRNSAPMAK